MCRPYSLKFFFKFVTISRSYSTKQQGIVSKSFIPLVQNMLGNSQYTQLTNILPVDYVSMSVGFLNTIYTVNCLQRCFLTYIHVYTY